MTALPFCSTDYGAGSSDSFDLLDLLGDNGKLLEASDDTTVSKIVSLEVARAAADMFKRTERLSTAKFSLTRPHIIKGWLYEGETSIVFAPSSVGKTSWVLDMTRAITADEDWHGYHTSKGAAVLYIAAEAPGSIYRRTVLFPDQAKDRFMVFGEPVDLVSDAQAGDKIAALAERCEAEFRTRIGLVVFDTFALCLGDGDENSTRDAGRALRSAKAVAEKSGAHVMLVHHTGKDRSAGARGSYAITAGADTVIELVPLDNGDKSVMAVQRKQREGDIEVAMSFKVVPVHLGNDAEGDPITIGGIEVLESGADVRRLDSRKSDKGMEIVLATLRALESEAEPSSTGFTATQIAEACAETFRPGSEMESRKKAVRGILKQAASSTPPQVVKTGHNYQLMPSPAKKA